MDVRWESYSRLPGSGREFECYVGTLLEDLGYKAQMTPASNDYGVDLLLEEPDSKSKIAVQVKFYNNAALGNAPIQEVIAGLAYYEADEGWVITNGSFSSNAIKLAKANNIRLIDNSKLNELISDAQGRSRNRVTLRHKPDLSGLDVIQSTPMSENAAEINGNPRMSEGAKAQFVSVERRIAPLPNEKTFNKSDVRVRWGCSNGFIDKQIAQGMPMEKLSNGRWSISEYDLVAWENHMSERIEQEKRSNKRWAVGSTSIIILLIVVFAIVILRPFQVF